MPTVPERLFDEYKTEADLVQLLNVADENLYRDFKQKTDPSTLSLAEEDRKTFSKRLFDKHFVEANRLPELTLYKALAPKFGLLPSSLLLPITSFYENVQLLEVSVPRLVQAEDRPYSYGSLFVLHPALRAVKEIVPAHRKIEELVRINDKASGKPLDLSDAESVVSMEEERFNGD